MLKTWLIKTFCKKRTLLENILVELKNIHYHFDRMETFYMIVNKIKEDKEKITIGDIIVSKNGKK